MVIVSVGQLYAAVVAYLLASLSVVDLNEDRNSENPVRTGINVQSTSLSLVYSEPKSDEESDSDPENSVPQGVDVHQHGPGMHDEGSVRGPSLSDDHAQGDNSMDSAGHDTSRPSTVSDCSSVSGLNDSDTEQSR